MMTEADRAEAGRALGSMKMAHRDVAIAIAMTLTLNEVPFQKQRQMLPILNEILSDMGIVKEVCSITLTQYLKVARWAGLVESTTNSDNRAQTIVTLTEVGGKLPIYYADALSVDAVDPADIPLVQWFFHRKRSMEVGKHFSVSQIYTELMPTTQFASRFKGASLTMLSAYTLNILKSSVFNQKFKISGDGTSVEVLESLKLF